MARRKKQPDDPSPENPENTSGDDTFGLPEIEYEPIKREEPAAQESASKPVVEQPQTPTSMEQEDVQQNEYNTYYDEDDNGSPWPKILGILAVIVIIGGGLWWYFGSYKPGQEAKEAERVRQEQLALEEKRREAERLAEQKRLDDEQRRADSLASLKPATGIVQTLNERTGRYYVIIASAVDGDLLMDYANKLAAEGQNPKVIPPYGKVKFYRLAIAEGDTYATTQATADDLKSQYTEGAWVVKY